MANICLEAERTIDYLSLYKQIKNSTPLPIKTCESVASSAVSAAVYGSNIDLILILSESGVLVRLVSKYRPECKILACCLNTNVVRYINMMRGVIGLKIPTFIGLETVI